MGALGKVLRRQQAAMSRGDPKGSQNAAKHDNLLLKRRLQGLSRCKSKGRGWCRELEVGEQEGAGLARWNGDDSGKNFKITR